MISFTKMFIPSRMILSLLRGRQCKRILFCVAALLAGLAAPTAQAHDFWIEPTAFRVNVGEKIPLQLLVGQDFKGNAALYNPDQFERYVYASRGGERPVPGKLGDDPAGSVTVAQAGLYVVGYYSKKFDVTFDNVAEFERYLLMEGLERNVEPARKRARGSILEMYARCAKSLIAAPGAELDRADHVFGFPLELVAVTNPYRQNDLTLRLLYRGQPLEGALVTAFNKAAPQTKLKAHTDKDGRVTFALTRPGTWLVASVHQVPTAWYVRADWESFWASLTFDLPAR